MPFP